MVKINEKELKELFIEIKNNNKKAYEEFYNKYNKLVYGIAFSILKNKQDAEDIVQTIFAKIYAIDKEKLPDINPASWLYTITKNEAITVLRKRNNDLNLDSIYEIEAEDNQLDEVIDKDSYNRLISKLNNQEKEIISLKVLGNLSFEQISKMLNEPTGTIKWRYYKAKHTLKILLSNLGMFIITFIVGIKALSRNRMENSNQIVQDNFMAEVNLENKEQNITESRPTEEQNKSEENKDVLDKNEEEKQETIIQETQQPDINYVGLGMFSISAIFLIVTIFFTIIFTKHQLKRNKKPSK